MVLYVKNLIKEDEYNYYLHHMGLVDCIITTARMATKFV